jgi:hypothetical protein
MSTMEPDEGAQPDEERDTDDDEREDKRPAWQKPPASNPDRPAWQ